MPKGENSKKEPEENWLPPTPASNEAIQELRNSIQKLEKTTSTYSNVMFGLTFALLILAAVEVWNLIQYQIPLAKLEGALHVQRVIESCERNPEGGTWVDPDGNIHDCSEMPEEWKKR